MELVWQSTDRSARSCLIRQAGVAPKSQDADKLQLNVRVEDLKPHECFQSHFAGEEQTAMVPATPPGANLIPGMTAVLHHAIPKDSKPVYAIERLFDGVSSVDVLAQQAYKTNHRCRLCCGHHLGVLCGAIRILCHVVLCCVVLCCAVPCRAVPCCAVDSKACATANATRLHVTQFANLQRIPFTFVFQTSYMFPKQSHHSKNT